MTAWSRDYSSRLVRTEFVTHSDCESLSFESSSKSLSIMTDEEQDERRVGNRNRTLKDYLQPARTSSFDALYNLLMQIISVLKLA